MELEFQELELRYERLRVIQPAREKRLLASLAESGQQVPILVVPKTPAGSYVVLARISHQQDLRGRFRLGRGRPDRRRFRLLPRRVGSGVPLAGDRTEPACRSQVNPVFSVG